MTKAKHSTPLSVSSIHPFHCDRFQLSKLFNYLPLIYIPRPRLVILHLCANVDELPFLGGGGGGNRSAGVGVGVKVLGLPRVLLNFNLECLLQSSQQSLPDFEK